jgi:putative ABC transport system permease protein
MFKNYFKSTFRILIKDKRYSLINIVGLSTGLVLFLTISLFIQRELSFDKHNDGFEDIYRVNLVADNTDGIPESYAATYEPLANAVKSELPSVTAATRFFPPAAQLSFRSGDEKISIEDIFYTDPDFFKVFTLEWITKDESLLNNPNTTVISEAMAIRFFGTTDVLGKTLTYEDPQQKHSVEITGVFKTSNAPSHLTYEMLIAYNSGVNFWKSGLDGNWRMMFVYTYFKTNGLVSEDDLSTQLAALAPKYKGAETTVSFKKQALTGVYWAASLYEPGINGNKSYIYVFGTFALVVLILAAVNFVNLMTARSIRRSKEVAIRKIIGANKRGLISQFLLESITLATFSMVVAGVTVERLIPIINANFDLQIAFNIFDNLLLASIVFLTPLVLGVLSGIYPALILSSFNANNIISGKTKWNFSHENLRKGLLVFQFLISVLIISGVMVINQQMNFIKNEGLGFTENPVIVLPRIGDESSSLIRTELANEPGIEGIASLSSIPGYRTPRRRNIKASGTTGGGIAANGIWVSEQYADIIKIEFTSGRNFKTSDQENTVILNEQAVTDLGWTIEEAVGKKIVMTGRGGFDATTYEVLGVVENYHYQSMYEKVAPLFLKNNQNGNGGGASIVEISKERFEESILTLQATWDRIEKSEAFDYYFLDDALNDVYQKEVKLSKTVNYVSGISILICFLGLFGLVTLTLESKKKEIGIRKILGASGQTIIKLLSSSYTKTILVSIVVGLPLSYYLLDKWLSNFVYRVNYSFGIYFAVGLGILALSILLIGVQSWKATRSNPIDSLREE